MVKLKSFVVNEQIVENHFPSLLEILSLAFLLGVLGEAWEIWKQDEVCPRPGFTLRVHCITSELLVAPGKHVDHAGAAES